MQLNNIFTKTIYLLIPPFAGIITPLIPSNCDITSNYTPISFTVPIPPKHTQKNKRTQKNKPFKKITTKKLLKKLHKKELHRKTSLINSLLLNLEGNSNIIKREFTILSDQHNSSPTQKHEYYFYRGHFESLNRFLGRSCYIQLSNKNHSSLIRQYLHLKKNIKTCTLELKYWLCLFLIYWNKKLTFKERGNLIKMLDLSHKYVQKDKVHILNQHKQKITQISILEFIEVLLPGEDVISYLSPNTWHFIPSSLVGWFNTHHLELPAHDYHHIIISGHLFYIASMLNIHYKHLPTKYMNHHYTNTTQKHQPTIKPLIQNYFSKIVSMSAIHLFFKASIQEKINLKDCPVLQPNRRIPHQTIWYCTNGLPFTILNDAQRVGIIFKMKELYTSNPTRLATIYLHYKANQQPGERMILWFNIKENFNKNSSILLESYRFHNDCTTCKKAIKPQKKNHHLCGGCRKIRYCSTRCQKHHWKYQHRYVCKGKLKRKNSTCKNEKERVVK